MSHSLCLCSLTCLPLPLQVPSWYCMSCSSLYPLNLALLSGTIPIPFFATPWTAARQAPLSSTISQSLLKFMSVESMVLSNHLIICCSRFLLPSILPSIRVFSSKSALCIRWTKYWSSSISSSNEYPGLISFGIPWTPHPAVSETPHSLHIHTQWCEMSSGIPGPAVRLQELALSDTKPRIWLHLPVGGQQPQSLQDLESAHQWAALGP